MNELIGSFAGKRLAAFAALVLAIALLAGGGALSIGTAQAQTPATGDGEGLDHMAANGEPVSGLKITLTTGFQHTVCLVEDIAAQGFRGDTPTSGETGDPTDGSVADIDDLDWDTTGSDVDGVTVAAGTPASTSGGVGDVANGGTGQVRGPRNVLTSRPTGTPPTLGWNWVIVTKPGSEGTPTVTNPQRRFPNLGNVDGGDSYVTTDDHARTGAEACVYWTSTAPGTQIVEIYQENDLRVSGKDVRDERYGARNEADADGPTATFNPKDGSGQLEVTWVDADPAILVNRTDASGDPTAAVVTAPISQRMVFTGAGNTPNADSTPPVTGRSIPAGAFEPASGNKVGSSPADGDEPATLVFAVNAFQDPEQSDAQLTGTSVSFAVTGTCGMVNVPGAAGAGITGGNISPGQTGTIARWANRVNVTFSNTGTGAAVCRRASSSTTLTITAGAVTQDVTVNWEWDGYGEYSVDEVDDTTRRVTFHTAVPRTYSRSARPLGWTCDSGSQARSVTFDLDGRASVTGFARRNTVGTDGPTFTSVTPTSVGAATPKRTLGATDSECQVSWTVKSPARAADVYLDITSAGVDSYSELLNFAPEAPATTTLDNLDPPLLPGTDQFVWTGEDTPVGDAIGDSGATAIYQWVAASQSWVSFFPGSGGLGVNTLTMLRTNGIYTVSTPR